MEFGFFFLSAHHLSHLSYLIHGKQNSAFLVLSLLEARATAAVVAKRAHQGTVAPWLDHCGSVRCMCYLERLSSPVTARGGARRVNLI